MGTHTDNNTYRKQTRGEMCIRGTDTNSPSPRAKRLTKQAKHSRENGKKESKPASSKVGRMEGKGEGTEYNRATPDRLIRAEERRAEESRGEQSRGEQRKAERRAQESRGEQSRGEESNRSKPDRPGASARMRSDRW